MPTFSQPSKDKLATCHPDLQRLFNVVVQKFDCTVIEGHRGKDAQNKAFAEGKSQKKWPDGNHNKMPSLAVDVAPYPIDFYDRERFHYFAGFVLGMAAAMGIKIRWGGCWKGDNLVTPNGFSDLPHYEIILDLPEVTNV